MKIRMKAKPASSAVPALKFSLFPAINRPSFADSLSFPDDVTSLTARNVSELHGKFTAMFAYACQNMANINVEILHLEAQLDETKAGIYHRSPHVNAQERWRRDAVLDSDPDIRAINLKLMRKRQEKEMTQMYLTAFERYIAALSRELSRKSVEQGKFAG